MGVLGCVSQRGSVTVGVMVSQWACCNVCVGMSLWACRNVCIWMGVWACHDVCVRTKKMLIMRYPPARRDTTPPDALSGLPLETVTLALELHEVFVFNFPCSPCTRQRVQHVPLPRDSVGRLSPERVNFHHLVFGSDGQVNPSAFPEARHRDPLMDLISDQVCLLFDWS